MFNTLIRVVLTFFIRLLRYIADIILLPLTGIFNLLIPDFTNFTNLAINFFDDYIIKAIACGREIFLNMTGFPQELITITVGCTVVLLTYIGSIRVIVFVKNMWRTFRGGSS